MAAHPFMSRAGPADDTVLLEVPHRRVSPEVGHALPDSDQSPSLARDLLRDTLAGFPAETVDTALLLVSELVTNAVVHAESPLILQIEVARPHVRVSVEDCSAERPRPRAAGAEDANGRGLWLVDALATAWGCHGTEAGGKRVWFEV
jgi:two-component sensor histidine kinase